MIIKKFKYLFLFKTFLLVLGISGILYSYFTNRDIDKKQINSNIVFILDLSNSMNTEDVKGKNNLPMTRLALAKEFIKNKIQTYQDSKFGLILFSNNSNYYIPPTKDIGNFFNYLAQVNSNLMPNPKSNIGLGINEFIDSSNGSSIGVLISDLANEQDYDQNKNTYKKLGKSIYNSNLSLTVVGIGSEKGSYVKNSEGKDIYEHGSKIIDKRNDKTGNLFADYGNIEYVILENYRQIDNIELKKSLRIDKSKFNDEILEILSYIGILLGL